MIKWAKVPARVLGEGFGKFITIRDKTTDVSSGRIYPVEWYIYNDFAESYPYRGKEEPTLYRKGIAESIPHAKRLCHEALCPTSIDFILDLEKEK